MKGTFYAVLEAPNGVAYHVPLDARTAEAVAPGDLVSFGTRPELAVRPIDRRIAERAREAGGIYALDPTGDERDRANEARRLRELERQRFVSAKGPDRWTVPPDLIEKLEIRARTEPPRERLWLEKVPLPLEKTPGHRGPVWLDKIDEGALAPWGFGADVAQALSRRREALRAFGVAPDDPRRDGKLREIERRAVGEGMAARTSQEFIAKTPERFRGKVRAGPEGVPYAVVTNGLQFILVPASRDLRSLAGKAVEVLRDPQGRISVRAIDRDLGR
jgi:hypothetical protein